MRERRRQSLLPSDPEEGDASEVSWAGKRKGGQLAWIDGYSLLRQPFPLHLLLLYIVSRAVRLWDFLLYIVSVLSLEFLLYIVSVLSLGLLLYIVPVLSASLGLPVVHGARVVCLWDFLLYIVPVLSVSGISCCTSCPSCLSLRLPLAQRVCTVCLCDFLLHSESVLSVSATSSCTASLYCLSLRLPLVQRVCTVCLCDFLLYSESVLSVSATFLLYSRRVCTVCLCDFLLHSESVLSVSATSSCTASLYCLSLRLPLVQPASLYCLPLGYPLVPRVRTGLSLRLPLAQDVYTLISVFLLYKCPYFGSLPSFCTLRMTVEAALVFTFVVYSISLFVCC